MLRDPVASPRRRVLAALCGALGAAFVLVASPVPAAAQSSPSKPLVEVWKSPTCGCCNEWIRHLQANGFEVRAYDTGNGAARARFGIPEKLGSCHTAKVDGYVVEGHVPAADIRRLLKERPAALGLTVPGMPIGSPGMEQGNQRDPYDVLLVRRDGRTSVWKSYD
jgi:hypothetical protein